MLVPEFKTKTVPVYEMEHHLNKPTEEAKQFKRILTSVKDFKTFLRAEEVASLLEYKEKAELEVFSIMVELGRITKTDYDYFSLRKDFYSIEEYKTFKDAPVKEIKYYAVKQLMEELELIGRILAEANNLNYSLESVIVANVEDFKTKPDGVDQHD